MRNQLVADSNSFSLKEEKVDVNVRLRSTHICQTIINDHLTIEAAFIIISRDRASKCCNES